MEMVAGPAGLRVLCLAAGEQVGRDSAEALQAARVLGGARRGSEMQRRSRRSVNGEGKDVCGRVTVYM